jgi:hypothetical protein
MLKQFDRCANSEFDCCANLVAARIQDLILTEFDAGGNLIAERIHDLIATQFDGYNNLEFDLKSAVAGSHRKFVERIKNERLIIKNEVHYSM